MCATSYAGKSTEHRGAAGKGLFSAKDSHDIACAWLLVPEKLPVPEEVLLETGIESRRNSSRLDGWGVSKNFGFRHSCATEDRVELIGAPQRATNLRG